MKTNMNSKNYFSILLASALALCGNAAWAKNVASDPVLEELANIFDCDHTDTVVEPIEDADGGLIGRKVILGQDYGPLAFSNNFGAVTIDLNGWTIKGTNGVDGTATTAGGNGCAAIMVDGSFGAGAGPTTIMVQDDSGVQLWENGPYFAKCNVGATKPEESGYYFWWGDTVGYTNSGSAWVSVKDGATITFDNNPPANSTYYKTLETLRSQGWIDENGNLVATNDAATVHLGAPWRMPTKAELDALVENCTTVWTNNWNGTGINGRLVTGKDAYASKSIFLPTAGRVCDSALDLTDTNGYYWPSTPNSITNVAWDLDFASDRFNVDNNFRYLGFPVRAVRGRPAAVIAGGNGGDGNPAGKGSPAVADATGAAVAVTDPDGFVANGVDGAFLKSKTQEELEKIFDVENTATTVEPTYDESGVLAGHKVIFGKDYGPLALSNDFGAVALDLNGWTIKGADGTAGTGTTAGGSGGAAITICAGETPPPQSVTAISVRDPQLTGTPLVLDSAKGDAMVIDLEADTTGHFPVTYYSDIDFGLFNCDAYKTTKIVLRKVPAGTYACEPGAKAAISKTQVVTKPYYIGVFQVTKAQYDRVMTAGSTETSMKPEDTLSYNAIRKNNNSGYMLPTDPVASDSFMGVLAAKSGLGGFDLPTEVQWEIAARATSTEAYGSYIDASNQRVDMSNFDGNAGWYKSNSGYVTHDVGGKRPNLWGIHDTAGNVWEWCLDMYCSPFPSEATAETPYSGGSSGGRVRRGGSNDNDASDCRPSYRALSYAPDTGNLGFRLSRICTDDVPSASRPDYGSSAAIVGGKGGDGNPVGNGGEAIVGVAVPVAGSTELVKKGEDGALLKSKAQEELENIFDIENTGTTVEPVYDESGVLAGHKVTLGADYGPLALFNDFGAVTIDLNGWSIKGADGTDSATGLTAGGNGGAAITVAGECGAGAGTTAITITDAVTTVPTDAEGFDYTTDGVTFLPGDYCVVDLTTGVVTEMKNVQSAELFNTVEYKTTKMAFRYVPEGKFKAVCAAKCGEGSAGYQNLVTNNVELSAYWMAVFPVTEAQLNAVLGSGELTSLIPAGDSFNGTYLNWNRFRGGDWTGWDGTYANVPAPGEMTFVGMLNAKVATAGYADKFDLCTSFQWERAARAGTRSDYFFSDKTVSEVGASDWDELKQYAWYVESDFSDFGGKGSAGTQNVGLLKPNAWGLYDIYGNAYAWCLDWKGSLAGAEIGKDYMCAVSGSQIMRGGAYSYGAGNASSVSRDSRDPGYGGSYYGYRLVRRGAGSASGRPATGTGAAIVGGNGGNGYPVGQGSEAIVNGSGVKVAVTDPAGLVKKGEDGKVPGSEECPWKVGEAGSEDTVQAYTNGNGKVIVTGSGTPKTFAAGEEPWAGAVPAIDEIIVPTGKVSEFKEMWTGPANLITDGTIPYLDWDYENKVMTNAVCTAYTVVTPAMGTLQSGWYVVMGAVTNATAGIMVSGNSHLILAECSELYVTGTPYRAGIDVTANGSVTNSIAVYGQHLDATGRLTAFGGPVIVGYPGSCAIGSDYGPCGYVTINGGIVTATGTGSFAGIGNGTWTQGGGGVTINGGTVTANGGNSSSGIGASTYSGNVRVTINGGIVTATGGRSGAGIGSCGTRQSGQENGPVTINGGTVTATGGDYGAGIGGGRRDSIGLVTINGGTVTANGGMYAAGIGGGYEATDPGTVTFGPDFEGGVLVGQTAANEKFMTQETYKNDHSARFVTMPKVALAIPQVNGLVYAVTNGEDEVSAIVTDGVAYYVTTNHATLTVGFSAAAGYRFAEVPAVNPISVTDVMDVTTLDTANLPKSEAVISVKYMAWDEATKQLKEQGPVEAGIVTEDTEKFLSRWYVVTDWVDIVREEGDRRPGILVKGDAHLILMDDVADLFLQGGDERAGIDVSVSTNEFGATVTNSISIYGQRKGTGGLQTRGGWNGSGIGCGQDDGGNVAGTVVIHGGIVTAEAGSSAAGIGGGCGTGPGDAGNGGTVIINGGLVTAYGGEWDGAGIGSGCSGDAGRITINGGLVYAVGSLTGGAGIGGAWEDGVGGAVAVNGGTVIAIGYEGAAGIGAAPGFDPGTFTLDPDYTNACIITGMDTFNLTNVTAEAFGTKDAPGWCANSYVKIGPAVVEVIADGGATTGFYPSVQDAFNSPFTADQSVTNTVTLIRDYTETREWGISDIGKFRGTTVLARFVEGLGIVPCTARLDLNGHKLTGGSDKYDAGLICAAVLVGPKSVLIIDDSSDAKTGSICRSPAGGPSKLLQVANAPRLGEAVGNYLSVAAVATMQGDLTLNGGTVQGGLIENEGRSAVIDLSSLGGRITLTGGTVVGETADADMCIGILMSKSIFTMTGGKVKDSLVSNGNNEISITGGLFGTSDVFDHPEWVAKDYVCTDNYDEDARAEGYLWQVFLPPPGTVWNPWKVGPTGSEEPTAYTNRNGELVIEGKGPVTETPWAEGKDGITEITITDPGTELPEGAFDGMGGDDDKIKLNLPDNWKGELPDEDGNWYGAKAEIANVPFLVRNVKFLQRYPWNGLVDITADLMGYDGADVEIMASVEEKILKISAKSITGQTKDILFDENHTAKAKLVWDANYDFKSGFRSEAVTVILRATSAADRHYNTIMSDLDSFERNLADAEKRAKGLPGNDFKECVNRMLASCPRFSSAIVTARADAQSAYNASNLVETARVIEASVASNMAKFAKEYEEFRASVDKIEAEEMAAQAMFMASVQKFQMDIKALETMMKDCKEHSSYAQAVDTAERTLVTIKEDLNTLSRDVEKSVSEHDILLRQNDFNDGFKDIDNRIKAVKEQLYKDIDDADRADQAAQEELVGALDAFDKSVGEFAKEVNDYSPTTSGQTKAVEEAVKKIKEFGAYSAALKEAIARCASDHDMSANKQNFVDNINALKNELAVEKKKFEDAIANNSAGGVE